jgi:hypothetical protein
MAIESQWAQCDAYARRVDEDGRETVVICDHERHAPPGDATAEHHDEELGIIWHYDCESLL